MIHTPETLKAWQAGLGLSESGMAAYIGVPLHTWRKWINGTRKPDAAPLALLDLLAVLPVECPALHALRLENAHRVAKLPKATHVSTQVKKRASGPYAQPVVYSGDASAQAIRDNVGKLVQVVNAPAPPWVHVTEALPEWMNRGA